ncbi:HAD family hydrolase [Treponema sp. OttesenSCG-928-L16]|nr:HAD family hydrolase [Treponema sp. OttesenSCG-928-L16]
MKCFNLPEPIGAFIFDMDGTLYTNSAYMQFQNEAPIRRLAEMKGLSYETMLSEIERFRSQWLKDHGGKAISLGNVFVEFGVSIEETVRWREELYHPKDFLSPDTKLQAALTLISHSCPIALVTNNPVLVARKTLDILGVDSMFAAVIGLDTCGVSKPHEAPFLKASELLQVPLSSCVSVGDRYDIDIALPLDLGMGGILVDGAEDVYKMPELLDGNFHSCNP